MGYLKRLFGFGDNSDMGMPVSDKEIPEKNGYLKTVRAGGYEKMSVLDAMDKLNNEILMFSEALDAKKKGEPYSIPPKTEDPVLKRTSAGGFSETDVDAWIAELKNTIEELRQKI